ncbi:double-stranded RNA-specific editase 1-like isoform X2 [Tigriopus californicus]|uniref:double-stranded RNA-specific editase 1-like isoform X2 n=1 Tax=Tigriopus californicus TaxID=6832 RepID=UPI0027D9EBBB|nr:double-stranded RNA-specific editase 1-like isoform X2 [Tigriopus californicus]
MMIMLQAKRMRMAESFTAKNPVVALNDIIPGLKYELVQQMGPVHEPNFCMKVTVNGEVFHGYGGSKKKAKQAAASKAIASFVQLKNAPAPVFQLSFDVDMPDMESVEAEVLGKNQPKMVADQWEPQEDQTELVHKLPLRNQSNEILSGSEKPLLAVNKNPVMLLNELRSDLNYVLIETGNSPLTKRFVTKVEIEGNVYEGFGSSKKQSKQACAKSALNMLYNYNFTPIPQIMSHIGISGVSDITEHDFLSQSVADRIGKLIMEKYAMLMDDKPQHYRRKVLAGVVMTMDEDMNEMHVISISTGTKCVNGEHLSISGKALNDCHAEIISRRCLRDFLLTQLEHMSSSQCDTIGDGIPLILEPNRHSQGYFTLKRNVRFHLFINTAPCGDARIFSPHEKEDHQSFDKHPNRKARGQLRSKIESGEGTIPVQTSKSIQTWDGVLQGARLLTMSCSGPIYFHSVVLGSLFHPQHLHRALVGRIQKQLVGLPPPYRLHNPKMNLLSSTESRQAGRAPNYSMNWTIGSKEPEIVDAMKGTVQESALPSRLSKMSLFKRWQSVWKEHHKASQSSNLNESVEHYRSAKNLAIQYQNAKRQLLQAFVKAELGCWVQKPVEQDDFRLK